MQSSFSIFIQTYFGNDNNILGFLKLALNENQSINY